MSTDLVVLAADKSIEAAVEGILRRPEALQCRPPSFDVHVHPQRDPGCYMRADDFLRPLLDQYEHALVIFDRAWEGVPQTGASKIEEDVRERLKRGGWEDRADVVVIDPELEVWVFSDSPHVDNCLGWKDAHPSLRQWLAIEGLWPRGVPKPGDPKLAVQRALGAVQIPRSSSIYAKLASAVSLDRCRDKSFLRLRDRLRAWFPPCCD